MSIPSFPHLPAEAWRLWLEDALAGDARERVEAHVVSCADCRRLVLLHDPARAACLLRVPAPAWDGFWEELQPQLGPPADARLRRRWRLAASLGAAASLALAGFLALRAPAPDSGQAELRGVGAPAGAAMPAAGRPADRCASSSLAALRLTRAECEALYSGPIDGGEPELVVVHDLDLRGL